MKDRHPDINRYFSIRQEYHQADALQNELIHEISVIESIIGTNFSATEKYIFEEHLVKRRSIKIIALELNYTYSYTRQLLLRARDKLSYLLYLHK